MRVIFIPALLAFLLVTCRPMPAAPRYIVTSVPIDVGLHSPGLCVAIDPTDLHGVWWWEPGRRGCSSRSTGPGVFHADDAMVEARAGSTEIEARFRLELHGYPGSTMPSFVAVRLAVQNGGMRALASGAEVSIERRHDLEVPEQL